MDYVLGNMEGGFHNNDLKNIRFGGQAVRMVRHGGSRLVFWMMSFGPSLTRSFLFFVWLLPRRLLQLSDELRRFPEVLSFFQRPPIETPYFVGAPPTPSQLQHSRRFWANTLQPFPSRTVHAVSAIHPKNRIAFGALHRAPAFWRALLLSCCGMAFANYANSF